MIGLKLADGRFFPILEETDGKAKRVILTPAHENQTQVKVDLYRGAEACDPSSCEYIASLVLEHVNPIPGSLPELELILRLSKSNTLDARIRDLQSGEYQGLCIDLDVLGTEDFTIPDFDPPAESLKDVSETEPFEEERSSPMHQKRPLLFPALIAFVCLCLLILGILVYFIFNATRGAPPPRLVSFLVTTLFLNSYG